MMSFNPLNDAAADPWPVTRPPLYKRALHSCQTRRGVWTVVAALGVGVAVAVGLLAAPFNHDEAATGSSGTPAQAMDDLHVTLTSGTVVSSSSLALHNASWIITPPSEGEGLALCSIANMKATAEINLGCDVFSIADSCLGTSLGDFSWPQRVPLAGITPVSTDVPIYFNNWHGEAPYCLQSVLSRCGTTSLQVVGVADVQVKLPDAEGEVACTEVRGVPFRGAWAVGEIANTQPLSATALSATLETDRAASGGRRADTSAAPVLHMPVRVTNNMPLGFVGLPLGSGPGAPFHAMSNGCAIAEMKAQSMPLLLGDNMWKFAGPVVQDPTCGSSVDQLLTQLAGPQGTAELTLLQGDCSDLASYNCKLNMPASLTAAATQFIRAVSVQSWSMTDVGSAAGQVAVALDVSLDMACPDGVDMAGVAVSGLALSEWTFTQATAADAAMTFSGTLSNAHATVQATDKTCAVAVTGTLAGNAARGDALSGLLSEVLSATSAPVQLRSTVASGVQVSFTQQDGAVVTVSAPQPMLAVDLPGAGGWLQQAVSSTVALDAADASTPGVLTWPVTVTIPVVQSSTLSLRMNADVRLAAACPGTDQACALQVSGTTMQIGDGTSAVQLQGKLTATSANAAFAQALLTHCTQGSAGEPGIQWSSAGSATSWLQGVTTFGTAACAHTGVVQHELACAGECSAIGAAAGYDTPAQLALSGAYSSALTLPAPLPSTGSVQAAVLSTWELPCGGQLQVMAPLAAGTVAAAGTGVKLTTPVSLSGGEDVWTLSDSAAASGACASLADGLLRNATWGTTGTVPGTAVVSLVMNGVLLELGTTMVGKFESAGLGWAAGRKASWSALASSQLVNAGGESTDLHAAGTLAGAVPPTTNGATLKSLVLPAGAAVSVAVGTAGAAAFTGATTTALDMAAASAGIEVSAESVFLPAQAGALRAFLAARVACDSVHVALAGAATPAFGMLEPLATALLADTASALPLPSCTPVLGKPTLPLAPMVSGAAVPWHVRAQVDSLVSGTGATMVTLALDNITSTTSTVSGVLASSLTAAAGSVPNGKPASIALSGTLPAPGSDTADDLITAYDDGARALDVSVVGSLTLAPGIAEHGLPCTVPLAAPATQTALLGYGASPVHAVSVQSAALSLPTAQLGLRLCPNVALHWDLPNGIDDVTALSWDACATTCGTAPAADCSNGYRLTGDGTIGTRSKASNMLTACWDGSSQSVPDALRSAVGAGMIGTGMCLNVTGTVSMSLASAPGHPVENIPLTSTLDVAGAQLLVPDRRPSVELTLTSTSGAGSAARLTGAAVLPAVDPVATLTFPDGLAFSLPTAGAGVTALIPGPVTLDSTATATTWSSDVQLLSDTPAAQTLLSAALSGACQPGAPDEVDCTALVDAVPQGSQVAGVPMPNTAVELHIKVQTPGLLHSADIPVQPYMQNLEALELSMILNNPLALPTLISDVRLDAYLDTSDCPGYAGDAPILVNSIDWNPASGQVLPEGGDKATVNGVPASLADVDQLYAASVLVGAVNQECGVLRMNGSATVVQHSNGRALSGASPLKATVRQQQVGFNVHDASGGISSATTTTMVRGLANHATAKYHADKVALRNPFFVGMGWCALYGSQVCITSVIASIFDFHYTSSNPKLDGYELPGPNEVSFHSYLSPGSSVVPKSRVFTRTQTFQGTPQYRASAESDFRSMRKGPNLRSSVSMLQSNVGEVYNKYLSGQNSLSVSAIGAAPYAVSLQTGHVNGIRVNSLFKAAVAVCKPPYSAAEHCWDELLSAWGTDVTTHVDIGGTVEATLGYDYRVFSRSPAVRYGPLSVGATESGAQSLLEYHTGLSAATAAAAGQPSVAANTAAGVIRDNMNGGLMDVRALGGSVASSCAGTSPNIGECRAWAARISREAFMPVRVATSPVDQLLASHPMWTPAHATAFGVARAKQENAVLAQWNAVQSCPHSCSRGHCSGNAVACSCPARAYGRQCQECESGYAGASCAPVCQPACAHGGSCTAPNTCRCPDSCWQGASCNTYVCHPHCMAADTVVHRMRYDGKPLPVRLADVDAGDELVAQGPDGQTTSTKVLWRSSANAGQLLQFKLERADNAKDESLPALRVTPGHMLATVSCSASTSHVPSLAALVWADVVAWWQASAPARSALTTADKVQRGDCLALASGAIARVQAVRSVEPDAVVDLQTSGGFVLIGPHAGAGVVMPTLSHSAGLEVLDTTAFRVASWILPKQVYVALFGVNSPITSWVQAYDHWVAYWIWHFVLPVSPAAASVLVGMATLLDFVAPVIAFLALRQVARAFAGVNKAR